LKQAPSKPDGALETLKAGTDLLVEDVDVEGILVRVAG